MWRRDEVSDILVVLGPKTKPSTSKVLEVCAGGNTWRMNLVDYPKVRAGYEPLSRDMWRNATIPYPTLPVDSPNKISRLAFGNAPKCGVLIERGRAPALAGSSGSGGPARLSSATTNTCHGCGRETNT